MPTVPVNQAVQNATGTNLTSTCAAGSGNGWKLKNSTDEPAVKGAIHWHFDAGGTTCKGTVTISCPQGPVTVSNVLTCTHVYISGTTTTVSGTRDD